MFVGCSCTFFVNVYKLHLFIYNKLCPHGPMKVGYFFVFCFLLPLNVECYLGIFINPKFHALLTNKSLPCQFTQINEFACIDRQSCMEILSGFIETARILNQNVSLCEDSKGENLLSLWIPSEWEPCFDFPKNIYIFMNQSYTIHTNPDRLSPNSGHNELTQLHGFWFGCRLNIKAEFGAVDYLPQFICTQDPVCGNLTKKCNVKLYNIICKALTPNVSPEADFTCTVCQLLGAPTFLVFLFWVNFCVHYSQIPSTIELTVNSAWDCQINQPINIVFSRVNHNNSNTPLC